MEMQLIAKETINKGELLLMNKTIQFCRGLIQDLP